MTDDGWAMVKRAPSFHTLSMALKRLAEPDDIGGVVAVLASDEARCITGDTIHADGGFKLYFRPKKE